MAKANKNAVRDAREITESKLRTVLEHYLAHKAETITIPAQRADSDPTDVVLVKAFAGSRGL